MPVSDPVPLVPKTCFARSRAAMQEAVVEAAVVEAAVEAVRAAAAGVQRRLI